VRRLHLKRDGFGWVSRSKSSSIRLGQLFRTLSSSDSYSTLYVGTFKAITSIWRERELSFGTRQGLLNLVLDVGMGQSEAFAYPGDITNKLVKFLDNILEWQTYLHIDEVLEVFVLHRFLNTCSLAPIVSCGG
jgi:hypothetical protein